MECRAGFAIRLSACNVLVNPASVHSEDIRYNSNSRPSLRLACLACLGGLDSHGHTPVLYCLVDYW